MKKKFGLITIVLCVMCFIGIGNASAAEVNWDTIANDYKTLLESAGADGYKIQINPIEGTKDVQVSLENPTYGYYFIQFVYDDAGKTITYTNNRNVEKASQQTQICYRYTDEYFVTAMFYAILNAYKVGTDQGVNTSNWSEYGVTVTDGADLTYGTYNEKAYSKVVFDLNTFDTATKAKQGTMSGEPYKQLLLDLKSTRDPMGDCLKDFQTPEPTPTPTPVKTKENPKTGLNLPVVGGVAILVLATGSYAVLRRKNLFRSI